jgi:phenylalanyl-tRNA synthetase alpha chain
MDIEPLKQAALAEFKAAPIWRPWTKPKAPGSARMEIHRLDEAIGRAAQGGASRRRQTHQSSQGRVGRRLSERRSELELKAALPKEATDFTLPGRRRPLGKLHPLTQVTEDIVRSFRKIGFAVADGPEVEDEYHCFDALNTPADHPARDLQDTFYLQTSERLLLRTHTSSVQIRVMEKQRPPVRIIVPGRCIGGTIPTPRITRPSTRSRAFTWTAR